MASTLQMVAPATAPIDIHPSHSSSLSSPVSTLLSSSADSADATISPSAKPPALGESPADSGYESSWPSLSEAAAWSPPLGQKRQLKSSLSLSHPTKVSTSDYGVFSAFDGSHGTIKRDAVYSHDINHSHDTERDPDQADAMASRRGKGQRRRVRTQAYHAKRLAQLERMEPLVDIGSPQMEDDDPAYGPVEPPIPLRREWIYDSNGPMPMDAKSYVVMSWNILSPRLCHPSRLDEGCEPVFLDWNYRKEAIMNQIAFTDADIVCLQELELKDYEEYFHPHLSRLGYRSVHAYKMNVYEMRDGCAIFYRDSRFKLLNEHVLRFNQVELDDYNVKRASMARDTAIRFNLFHNLALVALFENRRTKRQVQVATTHLLADPAFPDAKMLQTAILTSRLEELKAEALAFSSRGAAATATAASTASGTTPHQHQHQHQQQQPQTHIPTILMGDFNSLPDSSVVNFLKTGKVATSQFGENDFGKFTRAESKHFYHHLGLVDSYKASILPFTNATRKFRGTIDYLLYDPSSLGLVGFLDHFEKDPSWVAAETTAIKSRSGSGSGSGLRSSTMRSALGTCATMSSSDMDSEMEVDAPSSSSSSLSSVSSTTSSATMSIRPSSTRSKRTSRKNAKKIQHLDFSKLFVNSSNSSTDTTSATLSAPREEEEEEEDMGMMRAPLPTALPNQHFPSDHIPLVAIFREREHTLCPLVSSSL
ncbi:Glucose-repressible alcohol dehydrogenase transcriptional effector [Dissophora globulifera]|uniref:Glucose-repressible alcohol dehydrogenase transcriptional effector n=1 Tax=Dissophora globulifera TaxID=979702 RepID=A0A9P6UQZ7_9FUNG|nr:Glucose-repressible alcohol dehydrogenase transcriptional effector [Dissophora globulifera]